MTFMNTLYMNGQQGSSGSGHATNYGGDNSNGNNPNGGNNPKGNNHPNGDDSSNRRGDDSSNRGDHSSNGRIGRRLNRRIYTRNNPPPDLPAEAESGTMTLSRLIDFAKRAEQSVEGVEAVESGSSAEPNSPFGRSYRSARFEASQHMWAFSNALSRFSIEDDNQPEFTSIVEKARLLAYRYAELTGFRIPNNPFLETPD